MQVRGRRNEGSCSAEEKREGRRDNGKVCLFVVYDYVQGVYDYVQGVLDCYQGVFYCINICFIVIKVCLIAVLIAKWVLDCYFQHY